MRIGKWDWWSDEDFWKKEPAANVLYTQAALGANWIREFLEASQIQTRKYRSYVVRKQFICI